MLALEILNNDNIFDESYISENNYQTLIKEAIKELEALENRSCEGCKYHLSDNGNYPLHPCGECSRFYSDNWESKC